MIVKKKEGVYQWKLIYFVMLLVWLYHGCESGAIV